MDRNRLKNIEQTEKAKREMMEARKAGLAQDRGPHRKDPQDEDYSSARCKYSSSCHPKGIDSGARISYEVLPVERFTAKCQFSALAITAA